MYEKERAEIRVLSTWADSQRLDRVRDLLNMAESEIREHLAHREKLFGPPPEPPKPPSPRIYA